MNDHDRLLLQQIGRTSRAMNTAFEASIGQALPRWRILQTLLDQGSSTQRALVQHLQMDPGLLTRQMKAMEAEGLVTRHSVPEDNRLTCVTLTAQGQALIKSTQARRKAFTRAAVKGLSTDQIAQTLSTLAALEKHFRATAQPPI
jgi:DNA-binding MarR family transcriptional regulator